MHFVWKAAAVSAVFVIQVMSTYKMVVVNGKPISYTASTNYSLSWANCITTCLANSSCLVIYELSSSKCQMFVVGKITTAKRLTSGNRIGVKRSSTSTCPTTLAAYKESGSVYNNYTGTTKTYTVVFDATLWTFNASSVLACPLNFKMFTRTLGKWCMAVLDAGGCVTNAVGVSKCKSTYGGVLSGVETTAEFDFINTNAALIPSSPVADVTYGFWVDGTRKSTCLPVSNKTASCNGTNEFTFSDPTVSTVPGGYTWGGGQPDGMVTTTAAANCIVARIRNKVSTGMNDCACTITGGTDICLRGYVCGVKPTTV